MGLFSGGSKGQDVQKSSVYYDPRFNDFMNSVSAANQMHYRDSGAAALIPEARTPLELQSKDRQAQTMDVRDRLALSQYNGNFNPQEMNLAPATIGQEYNPAGIATDYGMAHETLTPDQQRDKYLTDLAMGWYTEGGDAPAITKTGQWGSQGSVSMDEVRQMAQQIAMENALRGENDKNRIISKAPMTLNGQPVQLPNTTYAPR